jgi:predicted nuclease of predicted toxin-antitoxin system
VKLLIDANLSPRVAAALRRAGYQACHVIDVDLACASDTQILAWAAEQERVIVSSDSDFGAILARQRRTTPSFVLLRHLNDLTPEEQAALLLANLPALAEALTAGAVATVLRDRIRLRPLPFHPAGPSAPDTDPA